MKNEKSFIKDLFGLIKFLKYKKLFAFILIISSMISIIQILMADLLKRALDGITGYTELNLMIFLAVFFVLLFDTILIYFRALSSEKYSEKNMSYLRKLTSNNIIKASVEEIQKEHSGDFISRLTNDLSKINEFTKERIHNLIFVPLTALLSLIYLLILNWQLTIISIVSIPLIILVSSIVSRPIGRKTKEFNESMGRVNTMSTEYIKGIEVIKAFSLKPRLMKKYESEIDNSIKKDIEVGKSKSIINGMSNIVSILPFLITFGIGFYFVSIEQLTLGGLIAFINLLNYLSFPISRLPQLIGSTKSDIEAYRRVKSIIELKEERSDGEIRKFENEDNIISIRNLNFKYPKSSKYTLKNINLDIPKNKTIALVGESGSGKSTLAKLLLGFYSVDKESIKISGEDINNWNLGSLRENISFVPQDIYLFPGDVMENIKYGRLESEEEEIILAAEKAYADGFIRKLNQGYKTPVGELGDQVSGGQKQRISMARAFLRNSNILILDEATSALDNESERLVQIALEKDLKNKTGIIIAHRLSTIKNADSIIVFKEGEIIAEGSHEYLIKNSHYYNLLYKKQVDNNKKEVV